ncbi:MAG: hydroxymethylglutaryl-CoA lyase [Gammaproteobacteria bacterium]|nr:hydroxymethylglutaryl-CoA lyase [Gammaproteobacteria bacterium]
MSFPSQVKIVEVGARDGLQNEKKIIPADIKIQFINLLSETGLKVIEATSFVSPKWVPQLADHDEVFQKINKVNNVSYPVLIPNVNGLQNAIKAGVKEIAVFTTPSEQFSQHNTNCSVAESVERISEIMVIAKEHDIPVRGYLSCVLGCPYEGKISALAVANLAEKLLLMGCYEISLGDTIGVGNPVAVKELIVEVIKKIPLEKVAVHFHDTYGLALVNIYAALECGVNVVDSSVSGLGGCPYAPGATGNVATEDVVYMLNGMGIQTDIDIVKLMLAGNFMMNVLQKSSQSKVNLALQMTNNCRED